MIRRSALFAALLAGASVTIQALDDWPQWRGPRRDGVSAERGLLKTWPQSGPPLAWKASGAGQGYSSFAVAGGRLYTLGAREDREHVIAFDAASGKRLWDAPHGQRFSLDPPGDPTLGESLLENLSGPLSHRFGTMRDLVIGVTVLLPDGLRASSGGKVVKNVAGYDLAKLYCGSRGRLGSVERLALRLHPRPAATRTVVTDAGWSELHRSTLAPSAHAGRLGGEEADPWERLRELQAGLPGRVRWQGQDAPLVRPGRQVAYVAEAGDPAWSPLAERVVEALCRAS